MDNKQDFRDYLNYGVPRNYVPLNEREYVVIKVFPKFLKLYVAARSYSYQEAKDKCTFENLSHDYSVFDVRFTSNGKLWEVDDKGRPVRLSQVQNWEIHFVYKFFPYEANHENATQGEMTLHDCGYPFILLLTNRSLNRLQPVTCLWNDNGRHINQCPNCGKYLDYELDTEDEDGEDEEKELVSTHPACESCNHWHGIIYNSVSLVCAMHPYGVKENYCPDFEKELS